MQGDKPSEDIKDKDATTTQNIVQIKLYFNLMFCVVASCPVLSSISPFIILAWYYLAFCWALAQPGRANKR